MEKPKVCRGCFTEWENEADECPRCGWKPGRNYSEIYNWKPGDVLEKRYLVGTVLYISDSADLVVWRIYDNLLSIPCFVLMEDRDNVEQLIAIADRLQSGNESHEDCVVIQAIKKLAGKTVLVFSMTEQYRKEGSLAKLLKAESGKKAEEFIQGSGYIRDEARILSAGICLDDRYRITGCLGIGGFGITYLCEDILLHRMVALKEYFPEEWAERDGQYVVVKQSNMLEAYRYGMESFLKEIRITAKFIHTPHMVTVYDAIKANDTVYMVMEYISGISIGREMRARKYMPFAPLEVADIIFPVLDALEEIHSRRIIHSDISPGNIMRTNKGNICLIDMGAAKYNLESQPLLSAAFLKIDYAAPEQYRTAKEGIPKGEGPWTDVYALGATMYYLLTGQKPADVISRLGGKDTDLAPVLIGKLPVPWIELLQNAMALERTHRIQSVGVLKEEIERIL